MTLAQSYWLTNEIYFIVYLLGLTAVLCYFIRPLFLTKWASIFVGISYFISLVALEKLTFVFSNFTAYFISSFIAFIAMVIVEKGQIAVKCLYTILFFSIRWLLPSIFSVIQTYTLNTWLLSTNTPLSLAIVWTIKYVLLFSCFFILCTMLNRYLTTIAIDMKSAVILSTPAAVSSISYAFVTSLQQSLFSMKMDLLLALLYLALMSVILLFIRLYVHREHAQRTLADQATLQMQLEMTRQYVTHTESMYAELKGLKHDLRNHMEVLDQLLKNEATDHATYYMAHIQEQAKSLTSLTTGHPVTDVILQQKIKRAALDNIQLDTQFHFPTHLQIDPFDVSIVLNNLLDNAIQATTKCSLKDISIHTSHQHDLFLIHMTNPIESPLRFDERTQLPIRNSSARIEGIGLSNVQATLKKYDGHLKFSESHQLLTVTALFVSRNTHS